MANMSEDPFLVSHEEATIAILHLYFNLHPVPLSSSPPLTVVQDYISTPSSLPQSPHPSIDHHLCPSIQPTRILLPLLPQRPNTPRHPVSILVHLRSSPTIQLGSALLLLVDRI
jgi:hypothetical protein